MKRIFPFLAAREKAELLEEGSSSRADGADIRAAQGNGKSTRAKRIQAHQQHSGKLQTWSPHQGQVVTLSLCPTGLPLLGLGRLWFIDVD